MFSQPFKTLILKTLNRLGLELKKKDSRRSLIGALQQVKQAGLSPKTVIDVGAAYGTFDLECYEVFPNAKYLLIEPLEEYKPFLELVTRTIPNAEVILAAAAPESGEMMINVHPDLVGSSLYLENEESNVNGVPRSVPTVTLDHVVAGRLKPPFLIKIDVQGAELDVLSGAQHILQSTDGIILEVSLFEFFKGGPQFGDVIAFMKSKGFVVYDIFGFAYRPLDNALCQVDVLFVQEEGVLRKHHFYATPAQREEQNKRLALKQKKYEKSITR